MFKKLSHVVSIFIAIIMLVSAIAYTGIPVAADSQDTGTGIYHEKGLVKDYFFKLSPKQIELRNSLLKENPGINEGKLLEMVAPEAKQYLPSEAFTRLYRLQARPSNPGEPFVYLHAQYGPLPPYFSGKRSIVFDNEGMPDFGELNIKRSQTSDKQLLDLEHRDIAATDDCFINVRFPYIPAIWYKIGYLQTNGRFYYDSGTDEVDVDEPVNASSWADEDSLWFELFSQPPIGYPPDDASWWTVQYFQKLEYPGGPVQAEYSSEIDIECYSDGSWYVDYTDSGNTQAKKFDHTPEEGYQ